MQDEPVEYVIKTKRYFSALATDIDERQAEQLMNRAWGENLEIKDKSGPYKFGIFV